MRSVCGNTGSLGRIAHTGWRASAELTSPRPKRYCMGPGSVRRRLRCLRFCWIVLSVPHVDSPVHRRSASLSSRCEDGAHKPGLAVDVVHRVCIDRHWVSRGPCGVGFCRPAPRILDWRCGGNDMFHSGDLLRVSSRKELARGIAGPAGDAETGLAVGKGDRSIFRGVRSRPTTATTR